MGGKEREEIEKRGRVGGMGRERERLDKGREIERDGGNRKK